MGNQLCQRTILFTTRPDYRFRPCSVSELYDQEDGHIGAWAAYFQNACALTTKLAAPAKILNSRNSAVVVLTGSLFRKIKEREEAKAHRNITSISACMSEKRAQVINATRSAAIPPPSPKAQGESSIGLLR